MPNPTTAENQQKPINKTNKKRKKCGYFTEALKNAPQLGHLKRPTVTGFLPFGASVHVLVGFATSAPHFGHLAI
jgi:hypothetical protein